MDRFKKTAFKNCYKELCSQAEDFLDDLLERGSPILRLRDSPSGVSHHAFDYYGKSLDSPLFVNNPGAVCAVSFRLPPEYLEKHGKHWERVPVYDFVNQKK